MARLLQIDVECVAKFAFVRGNLSKSVFAVKHTDFYPPVRSRKQVKDLAPTYNMQTHRFADRFKTLL